MKDPLFTVKPSRASVAGDGDRRPISQTDINWTIASERAARNQPSDENSDIPTPIAELESRADLELAWRIRREIIKDDTLRIMAMSLNILAIHGHVMLCGPVRTTQQKSNIAARAAAIAGSINVVDRLEVSAR